jgi:hypothetical protein
MVSTLFCQKTEVDPEKPAAVFRQLDISVLA